MKQRCVSYSTAASYRTKDLIQACKASYETVLFKDVLYISFSGAKGLHRRGVFVFPYGATIMWDLSQEEEHQILELINSVSEDPHKTPEKESMWYMYGDETLESSDLIIATDDAIVLPSTDLSVKLAFSHGLAQSVKLSLFENIVKNTIQTTKSIPEHLAKHGRILLSRKEIRKKMGELFLARSSVNLHLDVLDIPEYFWDHADLEPLYMQIAKHLEIENRVEVLNQRLDVIHELFEMLSHESNHQHSTKQEFTVILLIVMEVLISLLREFR